MKARPLVKTCSLCAARMRQGKQVLRLSYCDWGGAGGSRAETEPVILPSPTDLRHGAAKCSSEIRIVSVGGEKPCAGRDVRGFWPTSSHAPGTQQTIRRLTPVHPLSEGTREGSSGLCHVPLQRRMQGECARKATFSQKTVKMSTTAEF